MSKPRKLKSALDLAGQLVECDDPGRFAAVRWLMERVAWEGSCAGSLDYLRLLSGHRRRR